jgi:hypothetical protein
MSEVRSCLPRFMAHHESLGIDESERVNHDLSFDRLYGIDDYGDGAGGELFEGLLGIYVDGG